MSSRTQKILALAEKKTKAAARVHSDATSSLDNEKNLVPAVHSQDIALICENITVEERQNIADDVGSETFIILEQSGSQVVFDEFVLNAKETGSTSQPATDFHTVSNVVFEYTDTLDQLDQPITVPERVISTHRVDPNRNINATIDHELLETELNNSNENIIETIIDYDLLEPEQVDSNENILRKTVDLDLLQQVDDNDGESDYVPSADENRNSDTEGSSHSDKDDADVQTTRRRETRKRKRSEDSWGVNVRKKSRAAGQEYQTKKNKKIAAKSLKPPCNCKRKCFESFSEDQRKNQFADFYGLDYNSQSQFISNRVKEFTKLRRTKKETLDSRRKYSRSYYMKNPDSDEKEVCQVMFLNTFDLTLKRVRTVIEKCRRSESGLCGPDERGKHDNHKSISDEQKNGVLNHIRMFPSYESHYSRSHTKKRYLAPDLSIQQMYRLYLCHCEETEQAAVSQFFYRHIFVTEFNLSFHPPKNDTCAKCDKLEILISSSEEDREVYKKEKEDHLTAAETAYEEKRKDKAISKSDKDVVTAMFDLQKCLPTPNLKSGVAFYKRQLWTFNLTVYSVMQERNLAKCYMWDETIAARGGQEIASCLLKYIEDLPPSVHTINFYSDCCSGQNRNIYTAVLFSSIFKLRPNSALKEINHKFLISGHTHLEADSIHACIEKAKKTTTLDIEIPRDWTVLIKQIPRKQGIQVIDMPQEKFYNFQELLKTNYTNRKKNMSGENMSWLNAHCFQYRRESPGKVFYKNSVKDESFKTLDLTKRGQKTSQVVLRPLNIQFPLPLAKKKLDDLIELTKYIHPNSRLFYKNLLPREDQEDQEEEQDFCPDSD